MGKPSNEALFSQRVGVDTSDEYVKPKLEEAAADLAAKAKRMTKEKAKAAAAATRERNEAATKQAVISIEAVPDDDDPEFFKVPGEILVDSRLKTSEKLVLVALCRYADEKGLSSPPSARVIAQNCGLTEYWTRETIKELAERGYISPMGDAPRGRKYRIDIWTF